MGHRETKSENGNNKTKVRNKQMCGGGNGNERGETVKYAQKEKQRRNKRRGKRKRIVEDRGKLKEEALSCEERNSTGMTFTSVAKTPSGHTQIHP